MRFAAILAAAIGLAASVSVPSHAATLRPAAIENGSPNVIDVAGRCGRYSHYVRGHRLRNGHYVRGHCVRNRHR
jgi:hypothetical protein